MFSNVPTWLLVTALFLSLLATFCFHWFTRERRFQRLNELGVELHENYKSMVVARGIEGLVGIFAKLTGAAALALTILIASRLVLGGSA